MADGGNHYLVPKTDEGTPGLQEDNINFENGISGSYADETSLIMENNTDRISEKIPTHDPPNDNYDSRKGLVGEVDDSKKPGASEFFTEVPC